MKYLVFLGLVGSVLGFLYWRKQSRLQRQHDELMVQEYNMLLQWENWRVNEKITEAEYQALIQETKRFYENARARLS